jgi:CheY-like chemotaxis protein
LHAAVNDLERQAREGLRILLAEDNPVNQAVAERLLTKRGYSVITVANGREVLAALDDEHFDLVLMDVQMPEMDGIEATAAIRRGESDTGVRLPIVAMTAHAMKGDEEQCLSAGMDAYITKPIRAGELYSIIDRFVPATEAPDTDDIRVRTGEDLEAE